MPEITIIAIFYNLEKFAKFCLDSISNQTFRNFECICVNDKSTDGTLQVLRDHAAKDGRFRVLTPEHNQGNASGARNIGLDGIDNTKYLMFIDGDDFIHPQTLELLHNAIEKNNADISVIDVVKFPGNGIVDSYKTFDVDNVRMTVYDRPLYRFLAENKDLARGNIWNKLYRYDKVKDFRFYRDLYYEDDYMYMLQVLEAISLQVNVDAVCYFWRRHEGSITRRHLAEKYLNSAIARIGHCYNYFLKRGLLTGETLKSMKKNMAADSYRMLLRKTLKKGKNRELATKACTALKGYVETGAVELKYLNLRHRFITYLFIKGYKQLAKILVYTIDL